MTEKQHVRFTGELRYAQVYPGQERGPHPDSLTTENKNDKHYELLVECSTDLFTKLKKAGIPAGTTLKSFDDTDKQFIKLKASKTKGDIVFSDPIVTDATGNTLTDLIGNGSTGIVTAELAPIKGRSGKVLRLKTVQVTSLVKYEKAETTLNVVLEDTASSTTGTTNVASGNGIF